MTDLTAKYVFNPSKQEIEEFYQIRKILEKQFREEEKERKKKIKDEKKNKKKKRIKYNSAKLKSWRAAVLARDNYTCQNCNSKDNLCAHHIKPKSKYIELCYEVSNGITLCGTCHEKEHPELHGKLKF